MLIHEIKMYNKETDKAPKYNQIVRLWTQIKLKVCKCTLKRFLLNRRLDTFHSNRGIDSST